MLAGYLKKSIGWVEALPYKELKEWQAYYKIEPFGETRMDLRFALMTANLISPHLKKGQQPKLEDYMVKFKPKRTMTPDEMKDILKGIC